MFYLASSEHISFVTFVREQWGKSNVTGIRFFLEEVHLRGPWRNLGALFKRKYLPADGRLLRPAVIYLEGADMSSAMSWFQRTNLVVLVAERCRSRRGWSECERQQQRYPVYFGFASAHAPLQSRANFNPNVSIASSPIALSDNSQTVCLRCPDLLPRYNPWYFIYFIRNVRPSRLQIIINRYRYFSAYQNI